MLIVSNSIILYPNAVAAAFRGDSKSARIQDFIVSIDKDEARKWALNLAMYPPNLNGSKRKHFDPNKLIQINYGVKKLHYSPIPYGFPEFVPHIEFQYE